MGILRIFSVLLFPIYWQNAYPATVFLGEHRDGVALNDNSIPNIINPVIDSEDSKPLSLIVKLESDDLSEFLDFASVITRKSHGKPVNAWRGLLIQLEGGVTWGRSVTTSPEPRAVNYIFMSPPYNKHISEAVDDTSVKIGFKNAVSTIIIGDDSTSRDLEVLAGRAPWLHPTTAIADWIIDRRILKSGDTFRIRITPLQSHPLSCANQIKTKISNKYQNYLFCSDDLFSKNYTLIRSTTVRFTCFCRRS